MGLVVVLGVFVVLRALVVVELVVEVVVIGKGVVDVVVVVLGVVVGVVVVVVGVVKIIVVVAIVDVVVVDVDVVGVVTAVVMIGLGLLVVVVFLIGVNRFSVRPVTLESLLTEENFEVEIDGVNVGKESSTVEIGSLNNSLEISLAKLELAKKHKFINKWTTIFVILF